MRTWIIAACLFGALSLDYDPSTNAAALDAALQVLAECDYTQEPEACDTSHLDPDALEQACRVHPDALACPVR